MASATMAAAFVVPWKLAAPHGDEASAVLVLLASAAILNSLIVPFTPSDGVRWSAPALRLSLVLAVLTFVGNLASAAAIARISAPLLSVLQRSEVLLVAVVAWVTLGERPHALFWVGSAVATLGLVWMHGGDGSLDAVGVAWGIASAAAFGGMLVAVRHAIAGIDAVFVNALRLWLAVAIWFLVHRRLPDPDELRAPLLFYGALTGLFGPFLGRLFSMKSSRYLEARFTALILLSTPALSVPLAWIFLGTVPSGPELEGAALMLLGIGIPVVGMLRLRKAL